LSSSEGSEILENFDPISNLGCEYALFENTDRTVKK
jgi:hypothetical protein